MTPKNKTALASAISGQTSRRDFLKVTGLVGGGLALAVAAPGWAQDTKKLVGGGDLNAYVQIRPDGRIVIYSGSPEMGQGIKTSLPMIVAVKFAIDPSSNKSHSYAMNAKYWSLAFGTSSTK